jgi:anti-sigma factor RsiW
LSPEDTAITRQGRDKEQTDEELHDVDVIMTAYVDGEVAADEVAEVDAHLEMCPPCRERASSEGVARQVLHAKAATLVERAPPGLKARCIAATPSASAQDERTGGRAGAPRSG